ncbi:unnamed protein product, partial [Phaeothamnion confervicola]
LLGAVLINCSVDFYNAQKSAGALKGFMNLTPPRTTVVRDGKAAVVDASTLVLGDIVRLNAGDKVPADVRVIACDAMK